jgi:hypothetical protein
MKNIQTIELSERELPQTRSPIRSDSPEKYSEKNTTHTRTGRKELKISNETPKMPSEATAPCNITAQISESSKKGDESTELTDFKKSDNEFSEHELSEGRETFGQVATEGEDDELYENLRLKRELLKNKVRNNDNVQNQREFFPKIEPFSEISELSKKNGEIIIDYENLQTKTTSFEYQKIKFDFLFHFEDASNQRNHLPINSPLISLVNTSRPEAASRASECNNHKEFNITKELLIDIKKVLEFDETILREQQCYWLNFDHSFNNIQQKRIKNTLETHCLTPINWLDTQTIEIVITSTKRIIRRKGCIIEQLS